MRALVTFESTYGNRKRLHRRGFQVAVEPESFFVEDAEGPLAEGELERARGSGRMIASQITSTAEEATR